MQIRRLSITAQETHSAGPLVSLQDIIYISVCKDREGKKKEFTSYRHFQGSDAFPPSIRSRNMSKHKRTIKTVNSSHRSCPCTMMPIHIRIRNVVCAISYNLKPRDSQPRPEPYFFFLSNLVNLSRPLSRTHMTRKQQPETNHSVANLLQQCSTIV